MESDQTFHPGVENKKIGDISDNLLQKAQFILVSNVTLCTRAAMDGGLPDYIAYAISDSFIRCISKVKDISRITDLNFSVLREFTRAVHHYRYRNLSQVTSVCCEYILRHLHDRICLQDLSEICHRSPNYISDLFVKELKTRPLLFIRERKLEYAKYVLKTTDLSVTEVSSLVAFPSVSSFIRYFKEYYNVTPQQYRGLHR